MSEQEFSPLMRQYREIKRGYPHAILFFRVGDFYEMFFEDAQTASRLLNIALTSRDKHSPDPVPLCGVPYHAATGYIAKLLQAGQHVAICEQVEDPKSAKGLVRREVVRVFTPGTLVDLELLSPSDSNYLSALSFNSGVSPAGLVGVAALAVSTGEFWVMEFNGSRSLSLALDELARLEAREILIPADADAEVKTMLSQLAGVSVSEQPRSSFDRSSCSQVLLDHLKVHSLDAFGCQGLTAGIEAAGAVLRYFRETHPRLPFTHIRRLTVRRDKDSMHLDSSTIRNLELLKPMGPQESGASNSSGTLISVLDKTVTAMGSRLLRQWLTRPLIHCDEIRARLEAVDEFLQRFQDRVAIRTALREVQDVARLASRIVLGYSNPRELLALKQSLSVLPKLFSLLEPFRNAIVSKIHRSWDNCDDLYELIEQSIHPNAPLSVRDSSVIKDGYHPQIDELRKACKEGKLWIAELESKERLRTGIESLKIRYNQVFGYYIEITKSNLGRVPPDYLRKQTLVHAERFTTEALKSLEDMVAGAEVKLMALEQEVFGHIRSRLAAQAHRLESMAGKLAVIDVLSGLSETAALHRYIKPFVNDGGGIAIKAGRHPVVERLHSDRTFVPNDTLLDLEDNRLLILTGPNMAGKSTYLRQVALIVLMAQVGSFVPADEAHIGVVDRIFTRVGASDNLAGGLSTFMVEMVETANILNSASQRSLILLDEIGRGTSTYDGLSIAWAVAEYIHDRNKLGARTLFATHYHEMVRLAQQRKGVRNYRVAVQERNGEVLFLRKIVEGGADRSYGIHVAKLAGLPDWVVERATAVLAQLEEPESRISEHSSPEATSTGHPSPRPHPVIEEVKQIDLFSITPLDALNRLAALQQLVRQESVQSDSGEKEYYGAVKRRLSSGETAFSDF